MATAKMSELEQQARFESMTDAEAAGKAVFNKSVIQTNQKVTLGILWNTAMTGVMDPKELLVHDIHNWSGDLTEPYPDPLPFQQSVPRSTFVHQGSNGSKSGVVYVDATDSNARMWLVAFDSPNNKCYVECGPKGPATDWELIEEKLNNSGNRSSFRDPVFGGLASARVMPDPDAPGDGNRRLCVVDFVQSN